MSEKLPIDLRERIKDFPVIGAPLFIISNPDLVIAQCKSGVVGSFPALNARPLEVLDEWLTRITEELAAYNAANPDKPAAPFAVNQICHPSNDRLEHDVEMCVKHRVPIVITSLNPPKAVVEAVHSYGGIIMHDIISVRHAEKALEQGVDGLICVAAGAGGHAGMLFRCRCPDVANRWAVVNFRNTGGSCSCFVRSDRFAMRWTGRLVTFKACHYHSSIMSDDGRRNLLLVNLGF